MATPSSIITRGYGTPGSVNLVVTRGYGSGQAVIVVVPGCTWIAEPGGRIVVAEKGGRVWIAGGRNMGTLVRNDITEAAPGSGSFRAIMDFGDLAELQELDDNDEPVTITSCTVSISPTGCTCTSPATIENAYRVSTVLSGNSANDYSVTFVATLSTGQVLPPRVATWHAL